MYQGHIFCMSAAVRRKLQSVFIGCALARRFVTWVYLVPVFQELNAIPGNMSHCMCTLDGNVLDRDLRAAEQTLYKRCTLGKGVPERRVYCG